MTTETIPKKDEQAFLIIEDVTKRFGQFTALDRIFAQGESRRICSASSDPRGCGKTTLLRAIAGLDLQDAGRIEMDGTRRGRGCRPPERGFRHRLPVLCAFFPNLTVEANVGYGLVNRRWPRRKVRERVTELLELVGLPEQGAKISRPAVRRAAASASRWPARWPLSSASASCSTNRCRRLTLG